MSQLPAYLINRKSRNLAQAAVEGLGGNQPPYISIKDNRFTLVDGAGNEKPIKTLELDIVIVDVNKNVSKIYYDGDYDPKATEFAPPTCWSDNGVGPSSQSSKPQHSNCMTCPHNQWGSSTSKMTGKQTKECNDLKKIAVLVPEHDKKLTFLLRVPPASLKNFKSYCNIVGAGTIGDRAVDLSDVTTRLSFESQGVLAFAPVSFIDEEVAQRLDALEDGAATGRIVGRNDVPYQGALTQQKEPERERVVQTLGNAPQAQPSPAPEEKRGRGRPPGATNKTKGELAREEQPPRQELKRIDQTLPDADDLPAFLKPRAPAQAPQAEPITKPDDALQAALQMAFNLP